MSDVIPQTAASKWAMFCHLSALSVFLGVPFGHLLGPLLVWLIRKDEDPEVRRHGAEALNFQITVTLAVVLLLAAGVLSFLMAVPWGTDLWSLKPIPVLMMGPVLVAIGFGLLAGFLLLFDVVMALVNTLRAHDGHTPKYFFTIRFLRP